MKYFLAGGLRFAALIFSSRDRQSICLASCSSVLLTAQFRSNVAISDKGEARNLRWKAHDAAQLVKGLRDRKVSRIRR